MQTSTDNAGTFINLVHDYNTHDKLQESCQKKKTFRVVLAATNDATYECACTLFTSKLYTSYHNIAIIALIIFEIISVLLEIPFDRGWPW